MHSEYHKGCKITLRYGPDAKELLSRVQKRIESEYCGAEIILEEGAAPKKVEAAGVLVPHGHSLSTMGEVDQQGRLIRPMGGELMLWRIMEIIREEEA